MRKLKPLFHWLKPALRVAGVILTICAPVAIAMVAHATFPDRQDAPRVCLQWLGVVLQFCGFWIVWNQLRNALKEHGRPGWWKRLGAWWALRPGVNRSVSVVAAGGAVIGGSADVRSRRGKGDGSTGARLDALEHNLADLQTEFDDYRRASREDAGKLKQQLEAERDARIAATTDLGNRIETQAVGSADWQLVGLLSFVSGIFYATAPDDLLRLVRVIVRAL